MPYEITKFPDGYKVSSPHGTKAKRTTKKKAESQVRLLNAVDHGFKPDKDPYRPENNKYDNPTNRRDSKRKAGKTGV